MGYYTIRLDPDATKICTVIFPWGKYSYKRLPMGIAGSPDIFQENRTEQLRKVGNFIDYYLDKFIQNGVFICHKHRVAKQRCSRNRGERALSSKLISCLGIVQLPPSKVEHMP